MTSTTTSTNYKFTQSLSLYFFLATWTLVSSDIYKSVMWTTNNPFFQNHNKSDNSLKSFCYGGELEMSVKLKDVLPIICPFENLIMQTMESQPSSGVLYENLWIVYDFQSYNTCNINLNATFGGGREKLKNKLLYKCNTPDALTNYFYRIDFKEDSPVSKSFYFEANTTYYFLATSDGGPSSLDKTSGGHCNNDGDNEIRMKFRVYVCGSNEHYTDPKCDPKTVGTFRCVRPESPTSPPTTSSSVASTSISPSPTISPIVVTRSCVNNSESSVCSCPSMSYRWVTSTVVVNVTGTCSSELGNTSGRTGEDTELLKSRDNWRIVAILFVILLIVAVVTFVIICYRLKKKYSVPCIYSKQISVTEFCPSNPSPQNTLDKRGLVNQSYDNVDDIDGPKKTTNKENTPQTQAVEMKQKPPLSNGNLHNGTVNTDKSDGIEANGKQTRKDTSENKKMQLKTPSKLPPIPTKPNEREFHV